MDAQKSIVNTENGWKDLDRKGNLQELKKCKKKLDVVVINISNFKFTYIPNCSIDFNTGHSINTRAEQVFEFKGLPYEKNQLPFFYNYFV